MPTTNYTGNRNPSEFHRIARHYHQAGMDSTLLEGPRYHYSARNEDGPDEGEVTDIFGSGVVAFRGGREEAAMRCVLWNGAIRYPVPAERDLAVTR